MTRYITIETRCVRSFSLSLLRKQNVHYIRLLSSLYADTYIQVGNFFPSIFISSFEWVHLSANASTITSLLNAFFLRFDLSRTHVANVQRVALCRSIEIEIWNKDRKRETAEKSCIDVTKLMAFQLLALVIRSHLESFFFLVSISSGHCTILYRIL